MNDAEGRGSLYSELSMIIIKLIMKHDFKTTFWQFGSLAPPVVINRCPSGLFHPGSKSHINLYIAIPVLC